MEVSDCWKRQCCSHLSNLWERRLSLNLEEQNSVTMILATPTRQIHSLTFVGMLASTGSVQDMIHDIWSQMILSRVATKRELRNGTIGYRIHALTAILNIDTSIASFMPICMFRKSVRHGRWRLCAFWTWLGWSSVRLSSISCLRRKKSLCFKLTSNASICRS